MSSTDVSLFRHIVLVGCGSSYYAGQASKYILEHLVQRSVSIEQAFSFSHYSNPGLLREDVLVIGVSSTGNTQATCTALQYARGTGATTLAVTAIPGSKITQVAQATILIGGGDHTMVKTRSYVGSLVALFSLPLPWPGSGSHLGKGDTGRIRSASPTRSPAGFLTPGSPPSSTWWRSANPLADFHPGGRPECRHRRGSRLENH